MVRACWTAVVVFVLLWGQAHAENWLVKEGGDQTLFAVLPVREANGRILDIEVKNLELYRGGKLVDGYGFKVSQSGETFDFDTSSIPRYYLRASSTTFSHNQEQASWYCDKDFFTAVVQGQDQRVDKDFKGLVDHYPKGTGYQTKYVSITEVLGQKKIREKMQPIEVWGFASSRADGERMVNWYRKKLLKSAYIYFKADPENYSGEKRYLSDRVHLTLDRSVRYTQDEKGTYLKGYKYRKAVFTITLGINGEKVSWEAKSSEGRRWVGSRKHRQKEWYWTDPGWHTATVDDRHVKVYSRAQKKKTDIWVRYKGNEGMSAVNVEIPQCD